MAINSDKLAGILRDSNLNGALLMVYQKVKVEGEPMTMEWAMGMNKMSEQAAIANILIALGEALLIDIRDSQTAKQDIPPNVDGITG